MVTGTSINSNCIEAVKPKSYPSQNQTQTASLERRLALSISETAQLLSVSETSVRRLILRGVLQPLRILRHIMIPAEQLIKLAGDKIILVPTCDQSMQTNQVKDRQPVVHPDTEPLDATPFLPGLSPVELKAIKSLPSDGITYSAVLVTDETNAVQEHGQHSKTNNQIQS